MVVSMQVLHLKLEPPSFLYVRRKRDMNLLAGAIAPSCDASNLAMSGQDTSIAVGPDKRTAEVPSSPRFETRKANLHDVSTAQPQGRRGPASVRASDGDDFSRRNAVSVLAGRYREYLEHRPGQKCGFTTGELDSSVAGTGVHVSTRPERLPLA